MRDVRIEPPSIDGLLFRFFGAYASWYVRRHFHAVRISGVCSVPAGVPLLVVLNHPAWWDPLVALTLARRWLPERRHYAPIDAAALQKYRFFGRLGFFGIEQGTTSGATRFLRIGRSILERPQSALWVTAQGSFSDPRLRPVQLRPGTGHLLASLSGVVVLPVALEYPFWEEKYPEALIRIGDAIPADRNRTASEWTELVSVALARTQDALAEHAIARDRSAFRILVPGRVGVTLTYDLWRMLRAGVRGERFQRAHGTERM
jgi:1-acyl-sn-glycerol-3-phosphate acyltransferase